jgi:hypothetical protein
VAAALLAVSAWLGACGGGSSPPPLTHGGLDVEANAICGKINTEGQAIPQPASFKNAGEVATYLDRFEPLAVSVLTKLSAVKPDGADITKWNALLAAERAGLAHIRRVDAGAHRRDLAGLGALFANGSVTRTLRAAAYAVGADRCG